MSGPGIVLVIRPGDNLYEVNDRVEVTQVAPRYVSNDIYVSRALATHIIHLARQAQLIASAQAAQAASAAAAEANQERTDTIVGEMQGTIELNVTPLKGAEALLISGQAPPTAPVMITLLATLSSELPRRPAQPSHADGRPGWEVPGDSTNCVRLYARHIHPRTGDIVAGRNLSTRAASGPRSQRGNQGSR